MTYSYEPLGSTGQGAGDALICIQSPHLATACQKRCRLTDRGPEQLTRYFQTTRPTRHQACTPPIWRAPWQLSQGARDRDKESILRDSSRRVSLGLLPAPSIRCPHPLRQKPRRTLHRQRYGRSDTESLATHNELGSILPADSGDYDENRRSLQSRCRYRCPGCQRSGMTGGQVLVKSWNDLMRVIVAKSDVSSRAA
jgi:hypothetical protein